MAVKSALQIAPNQKVVTIHKEQSEKDSDRVYVKNDLEAMQNAIRRMNGKKASGFILWSILAGNKSGYQMPISNRAFSERYGISKDGFDTGIKILIEQGFMVRSQGNRYDFFEYPDDHKSKSGESPLLNVGKAHCEMWEKPTFKSGVSPQDNRTGYIIRDMNREYIQRKSAEEGTQSKGVPPLASVQPANQPGQSFVKNETALQLAEEFTKHGFIYDGHGGGGFPGYLAHMMNLGYTERDFSKAFHRMAEASKQKKIRKCVGYFDTVLAEMYENGECENGFFLADKTGQKPIEASETVKEIISYFIDHDIRFDRHGIRGMVELLEGYAQNLDEGELWDIAQNFVEEVNGEPDKIRNHINYLAALADRLYPYN